ncbi:hypothetical protein Tco_0425503 [Tanacetum coccineum]
MAGENIDNLTMEQYLTLTRGNQVPGVVRAEVGGNVSFKNKSQFMWELREDTFLGNKNNDTHEHIERVLDIVSVVHHLRPLNNLKTFATSSKREKRHCIKLGKDSHGPIPGMTPAEGLTAIQTMADHSQKWHYGSPSQSICSNNNSKGMAAVEN